MNRRIIENAIENVFEKHLNWLEDETLITFNSEINENEKVVSFAEVVDYCDSIKREIVSMLCGDE